MKQWYLLYTKPRQELIAVTNLMQQAYVVYAPLLSIKKRTNRGWKQVEESLFPNYIFIQLDDCTDNWKPIQSTRGVNGFVRFGSGLPTPISDVVMQQLLAINLERVSDQLTQYPCVGKRVSVPIGGTWVDALVQADDGKGRVEVLLSLLGQTQTLWVDAAAIHIATTN